METLIFVLVFTRYESRFDENKKCLKMQKCIKKEPGTVNRKRSDNIIPKENKTQRQIMVD